MDSAGLGKMMRLYARFRSRGVQLKVTGASPRVLELFCLTKIDDLLLPK
jgi:anti-anti-sigma factor